MLPLVMRATQTTRTRQSVSAKLRGLEIPAAFQLATISAASNSIDRNAPKTVQRRLTDKATRLASKGSL